MRIGPAAWIRPRRTERSRVLLHMYCFPLICLDNRNNISRGDLITQTRFFTRWGDVTHCFHSGGPLKVRVPRIMLGSSMPYGSLTVHSFVTSMGTNSACLQNSANIAMDLYNYVTVDCTNHGNRWAGYSPSNKWCPLHRLDAVQQVLSTESAAHSTGRPTLKRDSQRTGNNTTLTVWRQLCPVRSFK